MPLRSRPLTWSFVCLLPLLAAPTATAFAQVGVRPAEEWSAVLDSPERIESMKIPELIARLDIRKGMVIADGGAGTGILTGPLALATGPEGVVYASDIDEALLARVEQRATSSRLPNVRIVLGSFTDPRIPQQVDLALMNDVLHHVQDRGLYLKNLARHLKKGGRLAIVDYTADGSPHRGDAAQIVTERQVNEWAEAAGLERAQAHALYPDRYFVVYTKR